MIKEGQNHVHVVIECTSVAEFRSVLNTDVTIDNKTVLYSGFKVSWTHLYKVYLCSEIFHLLFGVYIFIPKCFSQRGIGLDGL